MASKEIEVDPPKGLSDVVVVVLCRSELQADALSKTFDRTWEQFPPIEGLLEPFKLGYIGTNHVALVLLSKFTGNTSALAANSIRLTFARVQICILADGCSANVDYTDSIKDAKTKPVQGDVIIYDSMIQGAARLQNTYVTSQNQRSLIQLPAHQVLTFIKNLKSTVVRSRVESSIKPKNKNTANAYKLHYGRVTSGKEITGARNGDSSTHEASPSGFSPAPEHFAIWSSLPTLVVLGVSTYTKNNHEPQATGQRAVEANVATSVHALIQELNRTPGSPTGKPTSDDGASTGPEPEQAANNELVLSNTGNQSGALTTYSSSAKRLLSGGVGKSSSSSQTLTNANTEISKALAPIPKNMTLAIHQKLQVRKDVKTIKRDEHNFIRIADQLTPYDHLATHQRISRMRYEGTGEQFLQNTHVNAWIRRQGPRVLWIKGSPGTGKTILTSYIVNTTIAYHKAVNPRVLYTPPVIYFYWDYSQPQFRTVDCLWRSFVKQLLKWSVSYRTIDIPEIHHKLLQAANAQAFAGNGKTCVDMVRLFLKVARHFEDAIFIIDGLSEFRDRQIATVLGIFRRLFISNEGKQMLLLSGRPIDQKDARMNLRLPKCVSITLDSIESKRDIETIVSCQVSQHALAFNDIQRQSIETAIASRANGLPLLAAMLVDYLRFRCKTDKSFALATDLVLPNTFEDILAEIFKHLLKLNSPLIEKTLIWVTSAVRPLTLLELREAIAFEIGDEIFDKDKLPLEDEIVPSCEGLIVLDSYDKTVRLSHLTTMQYFWDKGNQEMGLSITQGEAQTHCAEYCLTFLNLDQFRMAVTLADPNQPKSKPSKSKGSSIFSKGTGIFGSSSQSAMNGPNLGDLKQTFANLMNRPRKETTVEKDHHFLTYAGDNWLYHCHLLSRRSSTWDYFVEANSEPPLARFKLPWSGSRLRSSGATHARLNWAARNGHVALVELLKGSYSKTLEEVKDNSLAEDGMPAIHAAVKSGNYMIISALLDRKPSEQEKRFGTIQEDGLVPFCSVKESDGSGKTVLHHAAELEDSNILSELLARAPSLVNKLDNKTTSAFFHAACARLPLNVDALLKAGAESIFQTHDRSRFALVDSAQEGDLEMFEFLLEKGAKVEQIFVSGDKSTVSALSGYDGINQQAEYQRNKEVKIVLPRNDLCSLMLTATSGGSLPIVDYLLNRLKENERLFSELSLAKVQRLGFRKVVTPITLASELGYLDLVRELLSKGLYMLEDRTEHILALNEAIRLGNDDIAMHFLDIDPQCCHGTSDRGLGRYTLERAIDLAVKHERTAVVEKLLALNVDVLGRYETAEGYAYDNIYHSDDSPMRDMILAYVDDLCKNTKGWHNARAQRAASVCKDNLRFDDEKTRIPARDLLELDYFGRTPLHLASYNKRPCCLQKLLAFDVLKVDQLDKAGKAALWWAGTSGEIWDMLLAAGANRYYSVEDHLKILAHGDATTSLIHDPLNPKAAPKSKLGILTGEPQLITEAEAKGKHTTYKNF